MKKLLLLCSAAAIVAPTASFAQSAGSQETEKETIVVTGTRTRGVAGVQVPDVPKTRSILTSEILSRQSDGQSILQSINLIPGVNYSNNDPYGSSGGNLRIRGFPGNRIALLWDGLPLNDTGNYAIFGGQQMDQELIDQVSVNLGTTDVDSPTPSAAGGVVSYRTRLPSADSAIVMKGSIGSFDYRRLFVMADTGAFGPLGTRAFISASEQKYEKFKGPGELHKRQLNARIYQPIGTNGDFVSVAGHYNRSRNAFYNSSLVSEYLTDRFYDNLDSCTRDAPTAGVIDNDGSGSSTSIASPASCTNYFNLRINPGNTMNFRGQIKLTLAPGLVFTADPGYQATLANGGGTAVINENDARLRGTSTLGGVDLNGDGDLLDAVRLYQPSNTRTKRYTFLSSLVYEFMPQQRLRVAYTFDRGNHRQTGEFGRLTTAGDPISVFGGKYNTTARIVGADGATLQNRDRKSVAQLQQFSGEYFGRFFDNRLTINVGVRAPFFKRDLKQNCFTSNNTAFFGAATLAAGGVSTAAGNPYCTSQTNPFLPAPTAAVLIPFFRQFERTVKYSPILPSAGVSFNITSNHSVYASFGKNFSSPSTDNLYRSVVIDPLPETTKSYEGGYRFRSPKVQAQLAGYWVDYKNRIVTAQDLDPASPTFGSTLDRNVGDARAYGFDAQASWRPVRDFSIYAYGSYINSRLKTDITGTALATAAITSPCPIGTPVGTRCTIITVNTKGAQFAETPKWSYGGRIQKDFGPISFGAQYKWVSKRFATDDNGFRGSIPVVGNLPINARGQTSSYGIVDADVLIRLDQYVSKGTSLRFVVNNLFNKYYFGNITTQNALSNNPRFSIGAPSAVQATLSVGL